MTVNGRLKSVIKQFKFIFVQMDILTMPLGNLDTLVENTLSGRAGKGLDAPEIDYDFIKPMHLGGHFTAK